MNATSSEIADLILERIAKRERQKALREVYDICVRCKTSNEVIDKIWDLFDEDTKEGLRT